MPTQAGRDIVSTQVPSPIEARSPSLPEPRSMAVRMALKLIEDGDAEVGRSALPDLASYETTAPGRAMICRSRAGSLYELAADEDERRGENKDAATIERISTLCEAAGAIGWSASGAMPKMAVAALQPRKESACAMLPSVGWCRGAARARARSFGGRLPEIGEGLARLYELLVLHVLETWACWRRSRTAEVSPCGFFQRLVPGGARKVAALKTLGDAWVELHQLDRARTAYERALAAAADDAGDSIGRAATPSSWAIVASNTMLKMLARIPRKPCRSPESTRAGVSRPLPMKSPESFRRAGTNRFGLGKLTKRLRRPSLPRRPSRGGEGNRGTRRCAHR